MVLATFLLHSYAVAAPIKLPKPEDVLKALDSNNADARLKSVESFGASAPGYGIKVITPVIKKALADRDPRVRGVAMEVLSAVIWITSTLDTVAQDTKPIQTELKQGLYDSSSTVRAGAVSLLGFSNPLDADTEARMFALLNDGDSEVLEATVQSLLRSGSDHRKLEASLVSLSQSYGERKEIGQRALSSMRLQKNRNK